MDFKCDELILGKTDADSRALTEQQETIINYVDNILADDFENLMSDIIAMHQWLVQDGYISKSSAGKEKLYMTTKFLNQKSLTI